MKRKIWQWHEVVSTETRPGEFKTEALEDIIPPAGPLRHFILKLKQTAEKRCCGGRDLASRVLVCKGSGRTNRSLRRQSDVTQHSHEQQSPQGWTSCIRTLTCLCCSLPLRLNTEILLDQKTWFYWQSNRLIIIFTVVFIHVPVKD